MLPSAASSLPCRVYLAAGHTVCCYRQFACAIVILSPTCLSRSHRRVRVALRASLSARGGVGDARELFIRKLVMHPLTIQVWCLTGYTVCMMCAQSVRAEIACNMWVRNGHSLMYRAFCTHRARTAIRLSTWTCFCCRCARTMCAVSMRM